MGSAAAVNGETKTGKARPRPTKEAPITTPLQCYIEAKQTKDQQVKVEQVELNEEEVQDRHKENFNKLSATEKEPYEKEASISLQQYQEVPRYSSLHPVNASMHPLHPAPHAHLNVSFYVPHSTQPSALAASACPV